MEIFEATLALLSAALILTGIAGRLAIPYPSLLVIGGLVLGFMPHAPETVLQPRLAFALFLPPILLEAAYNTSIRDFITNIRPIASLAVVLVCISTAAVAFVAEWLIPELPLSAAIVLGAIVSPPDAAAATAVLRRSKLPARIVTIIEGESLVNDAVALVIYNFAVAAVVTGRFSASVAGLTLAISLVGSVALGALIGLGWSKLSKYIDDPLIGITASFLIAFAAYAIAEQLHVSGVLTVVSTGVFFAWRAPSVLTADFRLHAEPVWELAIFILNAFAFILIGLQLPAIIHDLNAYSIATLAIDAGVIAGTVIAIRLIWVVGVRALLKWLGTKKIRADIGGWRESVVIGWSGMRGLISLAAALALPETIDGGGPFPARALILFLSFSVILATLVVQGMSLAPLIRVVGLKDDDIAQQEERLARSEAATAAIATIDKLAEIPALPREVLDRLRLIYLARLQQASAETDTSDNPSNADFLDAVRLATIGSSRAAVLRLAHKKLIGHGPLHKIQRELDLEEAAVKRGRPDYAITSWLNPARYLTQGDTSDRTVTPQ